MNNEIDLNTGETTPGLSANTMGLDQTSQRQAMRKRLLRFSAAFALLFAVALGIVLYDKSMSALIPRTLSNGNYTYSLSFYRSAKEIKQESGNALQYADKTTVQVRPTKDTYLSDCAQIGRAWQKLSSVDIGGSERPICSANNQAYYTNFEQDGQRHVVVLTYIGKQVESLETTKTIIQSVSTAK